jgi:HSP20 family protein
MLVRYNPFTSLFRRERLFPRFFEDDYFASLWKGFGDLFVDEPKVEFKETKNNYLVRAEFPGYDKDEIKAEVVDHTLTLQAEHKEEKWDQDEKEGWRSIETRQGSFYRSIPLPDDVKVDGIKAELKNGVLRLTLPRDQSKSKRVKEIPIH